ncbi:glutamate receptor 2-like isoform X1 [Paramuricea clavata]|uniref:Glutamate receptor 2-like isoform X1 n=1 Tax=Paramuricea clavata TaxID=317549 RepID=A0A7D9DH19_PARCT|nr:glutamate receptor 2-like isoform X1 [Paramuricea clavata]
MKCFWSCVGILLLSLYQNAMIMASNADKFAIGVLMDSNYSGFEEDLGRFITKGHMDRSLQVTINISKNSIKNKGGLLKNIEYFKDSRVNIIIDLERSGEEAKTLAEYLKIPVVTMVPQSKPQGKYTISMYPSINVINSAIIDVLLRYKVTDSILLYDEKRSRQAMNLHTKSQREYIKMEMMPELKINDVSMIKDVIRMAWNTQIKTVVLLCDTRDIKQVVNATLQSRLYDRDRQNWKWIVSDLDFRGPDYEPLDGFVGLTLPIPSWKTDSVDERQTFGRKIHSDVYYATVKDALFLINAVAMEIQEKLKLHNVTDVILQKIKNISLPLCSSKKAKNCGLTGEIKFDEHGVRKIDKMDFVVVTKNKLTRGGTWNVEPLKSELPEVDSIRWVGKVVENYICNEVRDKEPMKKTKKKLKIMLKISDPPFVFVNESKLAPQNVTGFTLDIVRELAKRFDFDYEFVVLKKGGSKAFVKALQEKKVDLAIGSFTITAVREKKIDFSKPFMDFKMALILLIPKEKEDLFNFHKPFSSNVWLMVVLTVFAMTFLLCCVDYFSPLGYRKTAENEGEGEEFNLMNSLWFATASTLQQGGDNTPKSPSGRILAAAFWFFILIIISTYTANLAAFFTNKKIESPIKSLDDLVYKSNLEYGMEKDGQNMDFLKASKQPIYKKMISHINEKDTAMTSSKAGVARARLGGYAYISETPILENYNNQKPCNTMLVGDLFEVKSYGFGLTKNSEYTNALSVAILKLREEGFIEKRRKAWWDEKSQCSREPPASATVTLELKNLGGVFIIMTAGIVTSFLLLGIEIKFKWIIDLILKAQENNTGNDEQRETVMRVEISQGERQLNPINRAEPIPPRRRWLPSFNFGR